MAWRRPGNKPLSEPITLRLATRICATQPQWFNVSILCPIRRAHVCNTEGGRTFLLVDKPSVRSRQSWLLYQLIKCQSYRTGATWNRQMQREHDHGPFGYILIKACVALGLQSAHPLSTHSRYYLSDPGSCLTKAYDVTIQRYRNSYAKIKDSSLDILRCMGSKFCVKFQRCPLKFHTKFWTHTPQSVNFTRC